MLDKILEWLFYSDLFQKHRCKFYRDAYQQGIFDQQVAEMYKEDEDEDEDEGEGETNGMV